MRKTGRETLTPYGGDVGDVLTKTGYGPGEMAWQAPVGGPPGAHYHAAADITSSTFATARLGSGSADSTKFLRGDLTWETPPSGPGGQSNVSLIRITSIAVTTTTSTLPLPMLSFALVAQSTYAFEFGVVYASAITSTGLRVGLEFVTMSTIAAQVAIPNQTAGTAGIFHGWIAASTLNHQSTFTASSVVAANTPLASTKYVARIEGNCVPQTTGVLRVTYATEVAGSAISTFVGTYGELKTIQ